MSSLELNQKFIRIFFLALHSSSLLSACEMLKYSVRRDIWRWGVWWDAFKYSLVATDVYEFLNVRASAHMRSPPFFFACMCVVDIFFFFFTQLVPIFQVVSSVLGLWFAICCFSFLFVSLFLFPFSSIVRRVHLWLLFFVHTNNPAHIHIN